MFVQEKGFYLLENLLLEGVEKVISRNQMNDFINRHRVWLGGFDGFQTHVYTIESQLNFFVSKEGSLLFEASIELMDAGEEIIDFGEWVYLREKGSSPKEWDVGIIDPSRDNRPEVRYLLIPPYPSRRTPIP